MRPTYLRNKCVFFEVCFYLPVSFVAAFSSRPCVEDGTWLVSGAEDNEVRVWNVSSGTCTALLLGHERPVTGVAVSVDGSRVGTSSQDWTNRFFDASTGDCLRIWRPYQNTVGGVGLSGSGDAIAGGAWDFSVMTCPTSGGGDGDDAMTFLSKQNMGGLAADHEGPDHSGMITA